MNEYTVPALVALSIFALPYVALLVVIGCRFLCKRS
jgi:hypothetical protein